MKCETNWSSQISEKINSFNSLIFYVLYPVVTGLAILLDIPGLRQILGFLSLSFVPGFLLLKILKVHNLEFLKTILYSIGLSIAFVIFSGLCLNTFAPYLGITRPVSIIPLVYWISFLIFVLGVLAYFRDKHFLAHQKSFGTATLRSFSMPVLLFLFLIPLLAGLGALLVTLQQSNLVLLILIPLIVVIPILIGINKVIPSTMYPLAVIAVALALLFQQALISPYLTGYDIHIEHYYQGLVLANGHWDSAIANNVNAMLSINMLCPVYSVILNLDSTWVLKIIYPMFFALVPLVLFEVYKDYCNPRQAFLASFFFMSMLVFFTEMISLARQQIAELFFVLIVLLVVEKKLSSVKKTVLIIVFSLSLIVSHYGLSYICIALLVVGWFLVFLAGNRTMVNGYEHIVRIFMRSSPDSKVEVLATKSRNYSILYGQFICFFVVSTLAWYMLTSSEEPFKAIVNIGYSIYLNLADFVAPNARESLVSMAAGMDFSHVPGLGKIFRITQYLTELFIIAGLLKLIINLRKFKINTEHASLVMVSALILFACMVLPTFSSYLNITRFYHIGLLLLSPLCILGGEVLWQGIIMILKLLSARIGQVLIKPAYSLLLVLLISIPYYLFNTGFVFEITGSEYIRGNIPMSMSLSNYREDFTNFDWKECAAANWLTHDSNNEIIVYSDEYGRLLLIGTIHGKADRLPFDVNEIRNDSYIYLRKRNIEKNIVTIMVVDKAISQVESINIYDIPGLAANMDSRNLVYSNTGAHILASR
jgi:uncharacterized membrane protein